MADELIQAKHADNMVFKAMPAISEEASSVLQTVWKILGISKEVWDKTKEFFIGLKATLFKGGKVDDMFIDESDSTKPTIPNFSKISEKSDLLQLFAATAGHDHWTDGYIEICEKAWELQGLASYFRILLDSKEMYHSLFNAASSMRFLPTIASLVPVECHGALLYETLFLMSEDSYIDNKESDRLDIVLQDLEVSPQDSFYISCYIYLKTGTYIGKDVGNAA